MFLWTMWVITTFGNNDDSNINVYFNCFFNTITNDNNNNIYEKYIWSSSVFKTINDDNDNNTYEKYIWTILIITAIIIYICVKLNKQCQYLN